MGMSLGIFGNTTRNMVVISKYINNLMEKRWALSLFDPCWAVSLDAWKFCSKLFVIPYLAWANNNTPSLRAWVVGI
jgi:hypothetical protein